MLEKRASTGYVSFFSGIRLNIRNSFVGYFIFFLCMTLVDSSYGARWVKVEVAEDSGDTYLWPSWLQHFVYPYKCEGERWVMPFNLVVAYGNEATIV